MTMLRAMKPFAVFITVLIGGLIATTIICRRGQSVAMARASQHNTRSYSTTATDAQKLYVESRDKTSEMLFNVSFASIAGLLALQFSEKRRSQFASHGIFAAGAFLIVSIYAGFLFHVAVSECLGASLDDMFGPMLSYPILCQFWFLFAAVVLAAVTFFGTRRRSELVVVCALLLSNSTYAKDTPSYAECARSWAASRSITLSDAGIADAMRLIGAITKRQKLDIAKDDRCTLAWSMLDAVRYTAITESQPIEETLHSARAAAEAPNLSPGELLDRLLSSAEIWSVSSGVLDIDGRAPTAFVTVINPADPVAQWRGYGHVVMRLPPGQYTISVSDGGRITYTGSIKIENGSRVAIDAAHP